MAQTGGIPNAWGGSTTVPILKKHRPPLQPGSHRPIQLLCIERKLAGRYLLEELQRHLVIDHHQYCTSQAGGTSTPLFVLNHFIRNTLNEHRQCALVFIDIEAAYDNIVRQFIAPPTSTPPLLLQSLLQLDISESDAISTLHYIQDHPASLINLSLAPNVVAAIRTWIHSPWLVTSQVAKQQNRCVHPPQHGKHILPHIVTPSIHAAAPCTSLQTTKGLLQGDPLSTALFTITYQIAIDQVLQTLFTERPQAVENFQCLPVPRDRDLVRRPSDPDAIYSHLAFADDLVFPLVADEPEALIKTLLALLMALVRVFRAFALPVNLRKGKSELQLHLN
eukprot:4635818-Amphidinium_carterae.3